MVDSLPARALVWANEKYKPQHSVSYSAMSTSILAGLVYPAQAPNRDDQVIPASALQTSPPQVVVVLLGKHMQTSPNSPDMTAALEDVSNAATWWMSLQQVVTDEASPTLLSQLVAPARTAAVDAPKLLYAGDCALDDAQELVGRVQGGVKGVVQMLQDREFHPDNATQVVLVCMPDSTVSEEAAFVSSLDTALKANGARFLAVYTSLPASPTTLSKPAREGALERRRQLLARDGEVHDALFVLQADLVRAFLVVFFTVVALLSGLCCLMSLDTPTKFEQARAEN